MKNSLFSEALKIADEILSLSREALECAQQKLWGRFFKIIQQRKDAIRKLNNLRELMNSEDFIPDKHILNDEMKRKYENIAKVDSKVFDIIKGEQEIITGKVDKINRGISFLKQYKRNVNSQELFHRTI